MSGEMIIRPIAYIHTDFREKFGIPRQSGRVPSLKGRIVFTPDYRRSEALRGIGEYSRLWLIFGFSEAVREEWSPTVRPPRLGGNTRMGVFATRSPFRPNHLGLSCVAFEGIEHTDGEGDVILVSGVDMLDNTPIYDIKPYIPYADSYPEAQGSFAEQNAGYRLKIKDEGGHIGKMPEKIRKAVLDCLADDPRPSYHQDGREYGMKFADYEVKFRVTGDTAEIISAECEKE